MHTTKTVLDPCCGGRMFFFDMQKVLRKKTKMSKNNAETCARIHVGRFIRNITKELNKRNGEE